MRQKLEGKTLIIACILQVLPSFLMSKSTNLAKLAAQGAILQRLHGHEDIPGGGGDGGGGLEGPARLALVIL